MLWANITACCLVWFVYVFMFHLLPCSRLFLIPMDLCKIINHRMPKHAEAHSSFLTSDCTVKLAEIAQWVGLFCRNVSISPLIFYAFTFNGTLSNCTMCSFCLSLLLKEQTATVKVELNDTIKFCHVTDFFCQMGSRAASNVGENLEWHWKVWEK